ncbi:MAG: DNA polymerase I [Desulfovibrionaceae bacterium]
MVTIADRYFPNKEPLYICDGSAFIYRGFYAYQTMQRTDSFPTSAIFIVTRILLKLLQQEKPKYFVFVLDAAKKNYRNDIYPEYKQNRSKTPEQLSKQIEPIEQIIKALGIPLLLATKAEADDYIASLAKTYENDSIIILGVDKDLRQCLNANTILWDPSSREEKIITLETFMEETGLLPSQWPDYQALIGDSADNIPGIPRVGPKTAQRILKTCASLEDIRDFHTKLDPSAQKKITPHFEKMFLFREITRLQTNLCDATTKEDFSCLMPNESLYDLIQEYELNTLSRQVTTLLGKRITNNIKKSTVQETHNTESQLSLFSLDKANEDFTEYPPLKGEIISLSIEGHSIIFLLGDTIYSLHKNTKNIITYISSAKECIVSNLKELFTLLPQLRENPHHFFFDISLAAYILNPEEREYSIKTLYLVWNKLVLTECYLSFMMKIHPLFLDKLKTTGAYHLYSQVELPLTYLLSHMEQEGFKIDSYQFEIFLKEVEDSLKEKEKNIYSFAGMTFNIRSSKQLAHVLYTHLNLPQKKKTKTGEYSTSQDMLETLVRVHPLIEELLEYRTLEKLRSTYLEPLPRMADSNGRIHTTFNQLATATGRLSSKNPNLQNIPIRGPFGQRMRECFCAKENYLLIAADYSQIELRILAHLSKEPTLIAAFLQDEDIHKKTASLLYNLDIELISRTQRQNAKTINFGLLYGMGPQKLAKELSVSLKEAKEFIEIYFSKLSVLKSFYEAIIEDTIQNGYVTTMLGRRRYLPEILSSNQQMLAQAKRQAINTRIQGSAADLIKVAMIEIAKETEIKNSGTVPVLQVHDELIFEAPENIAHIIGEKIVNIMSSVQCGEELFSIPLLVECGIAKTWGEAH